MTETDAEDLYDPNILDLEAESIEPADTDVEDIGPVVSKEQKTAERALKRLREYINKSLAEPDAEAAMLGVANGLLMKMLFRLEKSIESVLAEYPAGSEHLGIVMRGIEVALRLTWQVNRFTHLRLVLNDVREATARLTKV